MQNRWHGINHGGPKSLHFWCKNNSCHLSCPSLCQYPCEHLHCHKFLLFDICVDILQRLLLWQVKLQEKQTTEKAKLAYGKQASLLLMFTEQYWRNRKVAVPQKWTNLACLMWGFLVAFLMGIPDYTSEAVWVLPESRWTDGIARTKKRKSKSLLIQQLN